MTDPPRAPGWYPDPWGNDGDTRYYDGTAWQRDDSAARNATIKARRRSRWWIGPAALLVATGVGFAATGGLHGGASRNATIRVKPDASTSPTRPHVELQDRSFRRGDCVDWKQIVGEARVVKTVSCNGLHLVEMIEPIQLRGFTGPFPTDAAWQLIYTQQCGPIVSKYLGVPLDPFGRYGATGVNPSSEGWDLGERTLWCGIGAQGVSSSGPDLLVEFTGRARGDQQTRLETVGTCLIESATQLDVIGCAMPHDVEVTGAADLSHVNHVPSAADLEAIARSQCIAVAVAYIGHALSSDLVASTLGVAPESWLAGKRQVECVIGHDPGPGWVRSPGSLKTSA